MSNSTFLALHSVWVAKPSPGLVDAGQQFIQDSTWTIPVKVTAHHIDPNKQTTTPLAVKLN